VRLARSFGLLLTALLAALGALAWLLGTVSSIAAEPPRGARFRAPGSKPETIAVPERAPAPRSGYRRRGVWRLLALPAAAVAAGLLAVGAYAYITAAATATSAGGAAATVVNQGATPSATATSNGREVVVGWGASTLANGVAVDGYLVWRYPAAGGLPEILPGCGGTIAALTCTESAVPPGSWRYTVTPVKGANWRGAESASSGTVTVGAATLSLGDTLLGLARFVPDAVTTGAVSGFAANEGVTYRLDSGPGTPLTGSPTLVGAAGSATITSLVIPQATDGGHSVYALGDASPYPSQASAAIAIDTVSPTVSASLSPDANAAGWNNTSPAQVTLVENDPAPSGGLERSPTRPTGRIPPRRVRRSCTPGRSTSRPRARRPSASSGSTPRGTSLPWNRRS
jgi:hypothetical protein